MEQADNSEVTKKARNARRLDPKRRRAIILAGTVELDIRLRLCHSFAEALETQRTHNAGPVTEGKAPGYDKRDLSPAEFARYLSLGVDAEDKPISAVLLHAPGGAGKSSFLLELLSVAPHWNLVPFFLDFSRRGSSSKTVADARDQFTEWFSEGAFGPVERLFDLARKSDGPKPLLVVDGLNQASFNWHDVLKRIEDISNGDLDGAVMVIADRMVDDSPDSGLRRAVIMPLSPAVYAAALPPALAQPVLADFSWQPILSSPLFLNKFLRQPGAAVAAGQTVIPSRFSVLDQYFRGSEGCNFSPEEMRGLSEFAYVAYDKFKGTAFPSDSIEKLLYQNPAARLDEESARVLKQKIAKEDLIQDLGGGQHQFQHQILHDAFAALKVASTTEEADERLLRSPAFDILSLKGASSDAIELAVEALQCPDRLLPPARRNALTPWGFLTEVYDWNYRIAFQCVASLDRRRNSALRPWMRHAIYALNLERAFDPFLYTAARTGQLKEEIPQPSDVTYLDAKNSDQLREEVEKALSAEGTANTLGGSDAERKQFEDWPKLYFRNDPFSIEDLSPLWRDPFLSWTSANVIRRRSGPDEAVTKELMRLYEISKATSDSAPRANGFRWRIVHTLGRGTSDATNLLITATFDPAENQHVRYGAVRSLLELAVSNAPETDRTVVFNTLRVKLADLFPPNAGREAFGVRQLLRRGCAFNEPYVSGRAGWLESWNRTGLPEYESILLAGSDLAAKTHLDEEARIWGLWVNTLRDVMKTQNWTERLDLWTSVLKEDEKLREGEPA